MIKMFLNYFIQLKMSLRYLLSACRYIRTSQENKRFVFDGSKFQDFQNNIRKRGPDMCSTCSCVLRNDQGSSTILFAASVLWLQGDVMTKQPLMDGDYVMAFNGDIYEGLDVEQQEKTGDTKLFYNHIRNWMTGTGRISIAEELYKLHGPYAFIFLDKNMSKLYFGRDIFGRRSLLLGIRRFDDTIILTSTAKRYTDFEFVEVPAIGIFSIDLVKGSLTLWKWPHKNRKFSSKLDSLRQYINRDVQCEDCQTVYDSLMVENMESSNQFKLLSDLKFSDNVFEIVLNNEDWMNNVVYLQSFLEKAMETRVSKQPKACTDYINSRKSASTCLHATTGILFSGGVDCAILALISDKCVDPDRPIDLINVSFDEVNKYQSPDRLTALTTLEELQACCPNRCWNLIEINISKKTLDEERNSHIADLIFPLNTILDDSLGCAMWFAGRGQTDSFVSPARVLIVGMGADELFGGYTKHRTALKRNSWEGLRESLEDDWQNLPYKNLGRDDRVVSDHGRQLRTPYLDENVVKFARNLPFWQRTFPTESLPQGTGEKILLRSLAYHLGLKHTATLKKRALQFGSRIANSKENAKELSSRLV